MRDHPIVSQDEWLAARLRLLAKEKEFTRQRMSEHVREDGEGHTGALAEALEQRAEPLG